MSYPVFADMTKMEWAEHETRCWFNAYAESGLHLTSLDPEQRIAVIELMSQQARMMNDMERAKCVYFQDRLRLLAPRSAYWDANRYKQRHC